MVVRSVFFAALCSLLVACAADSRQNNDAAVITATGPDGTARKAYETIDVLIEDGKIRLLNVASQTMPES